MPFLRNVPGLETVYRDFAPKGVRFYLLYKTVTHPGTNGFVEAYTLDERLRHVAIAKERLGTTVPWICDSADNAIKHALNCAPNAEFVIGEDGVVLRKRFWHDPAELRAFLAERVGAVTEPTRVADLGMTLDFPRGSAPRGVVPPLSLPPELRPLDSRPHLPAAGDGDVPPFFAKLVADGDRALLRTGSGTLYLAFHLDPIYRVHWNNPAGGLAFTITRPGDPDFEPVHGATPPFDHDTDVDPREFLLDLAAPEAGAALELTVRYTVCDDADTFCLPVEQTYTLTLRPSRDAGRRAGDWMTELVGDPLQYDADGDGRVTRAELPPERAQLILNHHDRDHDGVISAAEADLFHDMIRIGKGETGR